MNPVCYVCVDLQVCRTLEHARYNLALNLARASKH
jgi:hypothetical protein